MKTGSKMMRMLHLLTLLLVMALPFKAGAFDIPPEWEGDVNQDGFIDISDVTVLIDGLLNNEIIPTMDVNADSIYDVEDVVALIYMIEHYPDPTITFDFYDCSFKMVFVRGGTFTMGGTAEQGSNATSQEKPTHQVTLSSYYISNTEVTQGLWQAVMGYNPSQFKGFYRPVDNVTWEECQEFIDRLCDLTGRPFRMLSEAEWEFAARGGRNSKGYMFAGGNSISSVGWYAGNSGSKTNLVQTKAANELGLYDMSGNVWEWCQDYWSDSYSAEAQTDPVGPMTGNAHVRRGGGWDSLAKYCRVSNRESGDQDYSSDNTGLRLAMDLSSESRLRLSRRVVCLEVGEQKSVSIYNGSGNYTVYNNATDIVGCQTIGEQLMLTGLKVGSTTLIVKDNTTQQQVPLTVIVYKNDVVIKPRVINGVHFNMIYVKGGAYKRGATPEQGSDPFSNEKPANNATLSSYSIGETEVTQELWQAVMGSNPSQFSGNLQRPVEAVTWEECQEFIARLNELTGESYRLPTEAEWEYAARGGVRSKGYKYAGSNTIGEVAWYSVNSSDMTHPVKTKKANELGIYDMSGNVSEWCEDWYGDYSSVGQLNPLGPETGVNRVSRGGNWSLAARYCRVARRESRPVTTSVNMLGLRLAMDEPDDRVFTLSSRVIWMTVGEQRTVNILNGNGDYTIVNNNEQAVGYQLNGEKIVLTGLKVGHANLYVTDNLTHARTRLTVIVTKQFDYRKDTYYIHGVPFNMVYVPQGIFTMGGTDEQGSAATEAEKPVHRVALSDYFIGETEVTQALWHAVMDYSPEVFNEEMKKPMENVSWEDCQLFVARLSEYTGLPFRLPTEAEWEFAARGGRHGMNYIYAGGNTIGNVAWYSGNSGNATHYVAKKTANELEIYDMSGNVSEWCFDWYGAYDSEPQFDPMGPDEGTMRVLRGGAFSDNAASCRVSRRGSANPESTSGSIGLRLALDYDNSYRLYLSRSVVYMEVGDYKTVKILNGLGDYTIDSKNEGVVDFELNGEMIQLTATSAGKATFMIKDNITQSRRQLTVIVTQPTHVEYRELKYKTISWWMMYVRDGAFDMGATAEQGSDAQDNERPVHRVALNDYYIGQTEVTRELWNAVMYNDWSDLGDDAKKPVEAVNWEDCQEFVARLNVIFEEYDLNFRLPTEAEWEFAARGGNRSRGFKYAGSNSIGNVGWYQGNAQTPDDPHYAYASRSVKTKSPNELGLYDMSGNASEWCQDWYGPYVEGGQFNPVGPETGTERVLRGGHYSDVARDCRVSSRSSMEPLWWSIPNGVGLRLAMDATNTHRFYLSRRTVRMYVGDQADVNIKHGTGEYEITGTNNGIVNYTLNGDKISVTGLKEGTASFIVRDTISGEQASLTVVVSARSGGSVIPEEIDSLDFNMIYVRGGTFNMGANVGDNSVADPDESPIHAVTLSNYYIGETEVTQRLWQKVMGGNPSHFKNGDLPVEQVSWEDCQEFVRRLNALTGKSYRLPTEAEWEYAARGGRRTRGYEYAGSNILNNVAWYGANSSNTTHPVKEKLPNELGIYDMSGNVKEWCHDCYGEYSSAAQYNPVGPDPQPDTVMYIGYLGRIVRGGDWTTDTKHCRVTQRDDKDQTFRDYNIGLRLAMDAPESVLSVSQRVVTMDVGDVATVDILNGSGNYSATGGSGYISYQLSGSNLTITALKVGTTSINIQDNVTGNHTVVTVIVKDSRIPIPYEGITFWIKYVWGGAFDMGATTEQASMAASDENPVHRVLLPTYGLGMSEVTQELWTAVMGYNPSINTGNDQLPVDNVAWEEAEEFIARLSEACDKPFRLPTEAEWEYAARGGWRKMAYRYSGSNTIGNVAWYSGNAGGTTHPVQTKQRNDEWIYDMSGNVDEWCQDWYAPYGADAVFEPTGPETGSYHVVRGGRWSSPAAECRVSARSTDESLSTFPGVRIAMEMDYEYWFGLSRSVISMYVDETRTVNVYNGSGNFTFTATVPEIANISANGDQLVITGLKKGRTRFTVYDNVAQASKDLTVIVRERPDEPELPDDDDDVIDAHIKMIYVKGGTFTMGATTEQGSDAYSNEKPAHKVTVPSFMISNLEVTQRLWRGVMGYNPSNFTGDLDRPVEKVTWEECQEFLARLNEITGKNYRLPTEAEWEYAARGGAKSKGYKYSGSNDIDLVAWYSGNSGSTTHIVGTKDPNELGLFDMSGNVNEWCQDWFGSYTSDAQNYPTGPETGTARVRRGGGWSSSARLCRVSYRSSASPTAVSNLYGLRLARDIDNTTWFGLSQSVIRMEQYERRTVDILNGHGSYTVTGGGDIVTCQVQGEKLLLTGRQIGTTSIAVTDNATNAKVYLSVVVTEPDTAFIGPNIPNDLCFSMIHVKGGTFTMGGTAEQGSDVNSNESPTHDVTLRDYYISENEVTQGLWQWVMGSNPSYNNDNINLNRPVENVTWEECQLFIAKLNALTGWSFRLPTEAEWEFAARGGMKSQGYKYAGSNNLDEVAWYTDNSNGTTHDVCLKNGNELGVKDMSGNVYEFCQDWYGIYSSGALFNPQGPSSGSNRIRRGGYFSGIAKYCRVSYRGYMSPTARNRFTGLRLAMDYQTNYDFILSQNVINVEVGGHQTVNLIHGGGNYTVDGGTGYVTWALNGDQLTVTGIQVGTTTLAVTDVTSGVTRVLTVVVTEPLAPKEEFTVNGVTFNMVTVDGGTFTMGATSEQGSNSQDCEKPTHQVTLSSYCIGETEVTQALWQAVMGNNPSYYSNNLQCPVEMVSWTECQEFILKLNQLTGKKFRLPTEAEWEFAARGGTKSQGYMYSGSNTVGNIAYYYDNCYALGYPAQPVGSKSPNELGIYDMSGNVFEWCQDWYGPYSSTAQTNPNGATSSSFRVRRGGAWPFSATECRVSFRIYEAQSALFEWIGFRLALDKDESSKFRLSETVLTLEVGQNKSVNILNGNGNYTVSGGSPYVTNTLSNNSLKITGKIPGITSVIVTNTSTGAQTSLNVIVKTNDNSNKKTYEVNGIQFSMINVDGGSFYMGATSEQGSDAQSNENPKHLVTVSDFCIGETEVTQDLYETVMGENPSSEFHLDGKYPVESVSWDDCQTFVSKLNQLTGVTFRLPTEAEWEFAARGGTKSLGYKYSGSNNIEDVAWYLDNCYAQARPYVHVATKAPNELGLYDMSGNVFEWCQDWYGTYSSTAQTNPSGPTSGSYRVRRGGAWPFAAEECRVSYRNYSQPSLKVVWIGFRLAMDPQASAPFALSMESLSMVVGMQKSVDILNGSGSYTVTGGSGIVTTTVSGNVLKVTGVTAGTATLTVKDNSTNATATLAVTVTDAVRGDVNCDGVIDENDYGELYFISRGQTPLSIYTADVDANGSIVFDYNQNCDNTALVEILYNDLMKSWSGYPFEDFDAYSDIAQYMGYPVYKYDINCDGEISISDFTLMVYAASEGGAPSEMRDADLDNDGVVNWRDACIFHAFWMKYTGSWTCEGLEEETFTVNGVTFKMVTVDGGTFMMGASSNDNEAAENERPQHQVTLSTYKIGKTEVTQALWQAVMGSNPSRFTGNLQRPVETITWDDCQLFVSKLSQLTGRSFRLPTEAEWEFAARGGNRSHGYLYSGSNSIDDVACYWNDESTNYSTLPVATKSYNELGLYDMSGNVCEWCQDWYDSYTASAQTNPTGPSSGTYRVARGGDWGSFPWFHRVTYRYINEPGSDWTLTLGLRLALDPDDSPKFRLSETVVTVEVGQSELVYVLNGSGSISVTGGSDNCYIAYNTDRLIIQGKKAGTCTIFVTDNTIGAQAVLNVIVTEPTTPEDHEYVDLGLPSGTLWATCNVGANAPEEFGDYFAWGETEPKDTYDYSTYKWCNGSLTTMTKYCNNSSYGIVDNKTELEIADDAAYVNWGPEWRMPTFDQLDELKTKCTWTWTAQNGVNGRLVTGPNGNTLFLPAAGYRHNSSLNGVKSGYFWSRKLDTDCPNCALGLLCTSGNVVWDNYDLRCYGFTVRPVRLQ